MITPGLDVDRGGFGTLTWSSDPRRPTPLDSESALLLYALREPSPLPAFARRLWNADGGRLIARLLLEGALEVEIGGRFETGIEAALAVGAIASLAPAGDCVSAISTRAIRHVVAADAIEVPEVADALYRFNTKPASPASMSSLSSPRALSEYLGFETARGALGAHWREVAEDAEGAWRKFIGRSAKTRPARRKLYINVAYAGISAVLPSVLALLAEAGAPSFKVGRTLPNVLRPDKWVVYLHSHEELEQLSSRLVDLLSEAEPQQLAFTAPIDARGILTWGIDPPFESGTSWSGSYRACVTANLALAIVAARASCRADPVEHALACLRADGFDTQTWTPNDRLWAQPTGRA